MKNVPKIFSAELNGIEAGLVEVEADINIGLHAFNIVGLGDKAVSEAKERVNSALKNSGIKPPTKENRRITINLAPADTKKVGSRFDLPIALAYLLASNQIKSFETTDKLFVGELSLDGNLRPINGALSIALYARDNGIKEAFVPEDNAVEAAAVSGIRIYPVKNIAELISHLEGENLISSSPETIIDPGHMKSSVTVGEIKGHRSAKRALLIAAAGGHHLLMSGPPGTGKTMLAQALASLMPLPSREECMEISKVYSSAGLNKDKALITHRPFRSPHSSSSLTSLLGGGTNPRPGEVSLAHRGVLFLDEVPEFKRDVIEGLRQPLEDGKINIARAKKSVTYPARFMLVLAQNPCPCGFYEDPDKECKCTANDISRYQKKLSGPLLDRIDVQIDVGRIPVEELRNTRRNDEEDALFRKQVEMARNLQMTRLQGFGANTNSEMSSKSVDDLVDISESADNFLKKGLSKKLLSARGYYRMLKVAQTIADIDGLDQVTEDHVAEAFRYRLREN